MRTTIACADNLQERLASTQSDVFDVDAGMHASAVTTIVDMNGSTDYLGSVRDNSSVTRLSTALLACTYFTGALIAPVNATAGGWQNDGTQSFLADSTDKVGIGTSTPWAKLSIDAPAGVNSFAIGSSTATYFLVNSSGNVGIGTTSPSGLFHVRVARR